MDIVKTIRAARISSTASLPRRFHEPVVRTFFSDVTGVFELSNSLSLPAGSKHLRVLEKAGLVRRRRRGRVHSLKLEAKPMQQASRWIGEYRKFWEGSFVRLDEYLKQLQTKETARICVYSPRWRWRSGSVVNASCNCMAAAASCLRFFRQLAVFPAPKRKRAQNEFNTSII